MIDRSIGKIKVRRGTDLQRKTIIFEEGELIYTTDTKKAFIGDNITQGGKVISNINYITTILDISNNGLYGDIIHVESTNKTYIIGYDIDNVTLKPFLIIDGSTNNDLLKQIDDLLNKISELSGCLAKERIFLSSPAPSLAWFIEPVSQQASIGDNITFTASAIGPYDDFVYLWQKMDNFGVYNNIIGALGTTFIVNNINLNDFTYYRCIVKSSAGVLTSISAQILYSD